MRASRRRPLAEKSRPAAGAAASTAASASPAARNTTNRSARTSSGALPAASLDDGSKPIPEPEEQRADGIDARLRSPAQDGGHVAPRREKEIQELGPHLGVRGAGDVLDQEAKEAVPAVQERLPLLDLGPGQGALGGAGDRRYLGQIDGDPEPQGVGLHRQLPGSEGLERHRQAAGGRAEGPEEGPDLLDGRPEIVAEGLELGCAPVPDHGPEPRGHVRRLTSGAVEVEVDVPEAELPVVAELGSGQDFGLAAPRDGREAPAHDGDAGRGRGGAGYPDPPVDRLEDGVADDERPAAVGGAPELERAAAFLAEVLPHGSAHDPIVDGQGEGDFDREGGQGEKKRRQHDNRHGGEWQRSGARHPKGHPVSRRRRCTAASPGSTHRAPLQHTRPLRSRPPRLARPAAPSGGCGRLTPAGPVEEKLVFKWKRYVSEAIHSCRGNEAPAARAYPWLDAPVARRGCLPRHSGRCRRAQGASRGRDRWRHDHGAQRPPGRDRASRGSRCAGEAPAVRRPRPPVHGRPRVRSHGNRADDRARPERAAPRRGRPARRPESEPGAGSRRLRVVVPQVLAGRHAGSPRGGGAPGAAVASGRPRCPRLPGTTG